MRNSPLVWRPVVALLLVGWAATVGPAHAPAADGVRKELARLASGVHQLLQDRGQNEISVGSFDGPTAFPATAGPGLTQVLTEEFQKLGVVVKPRAPVGISGKFLATSVEEPDPNNSLRKRKLAALTIKANVVDEFGRLLTDVSVPNIVTDGEFKADVKSDAAIAGTLGVPVSQPTTSTEEERAARVLDQVRNPSSHIEGTRIFAAAGSPYAIEILCDGAAPPVATKDNLAFVDLPIDKTYVVRLYNFTDIDAAAAPTIDGVSVFAFSGVRQPDGPHKGEPLYDNYIIPPKSFIDIAGWHKTNEQVDSFLVTEFPKSAAFQVSRQAAKAKVGTVTANFFTAWPIDSAPPKDEPPLKKGEPRATGFGPPLKQQVQEVKRNVGVLRASVSARYAK